MVLKKKRKVLPVLSYFLSMENFTKESIID